MIKHKNLRNKRRKVRRFKFDFEYTPISNIPVEYQIYIKAHRHFEATVAKYELLLENLIFAESLFEWIREIKCCIEEVEHQIQLIEDNKSDYEAFRDFRHSIESHTLLYILNNGFSEPVYFVEFEDEEVEIALDDINQLIWRIHDDIHKAGILVYDFWIDSRTMNDKIEWLSLIN
ncbi:hypothetical protein EOL70_27850 [Leucothrix sargassi]|nr:hypothetical protein EOL70_27850 [Leucothrix sargassi]